MHFLVFFIILLLSAAGCGGGGAAGVGETTGGGGLSRSASLSWGASSSNVDGTSMNDLAGYRVYYGTSSGNYTNSVDIGIANSVVIDNLTPGSVYYFVITAYDSSGNESGYSAEVSKTAT